MNFARDDHNRASKSDRSSNSDDHEATRLSSDCASLEAELASLTERLKSHPDFLEARIRRIEILTGLGRDPEILEDVTLWLTQQPNCAEAHFIRAQTLGGLGDPQRAIDAYQKATELDPSKSDYFSGLGLARLQLSQTAGALKAFNRALEIDPHCLSALVRRSRLFAIEFNDFDSSLQDLQRAISLEPDNAELFFYRGETQLLAGAHEDALASYDKALGLDPDLVPILNNKAVCLARLQRFEAAYECVKRGLSLTPDDDSLRRFSGELLWRMGRINEGLADLQIAAESKDDEIATLALFQRAEIFAAADQAKAALRELERARIRKPDEPEILAFRGRLLHKIDPDNPEALELLDRPAHGETDAAMAHSQSVLATTLQHLEVVLELERNNVQALLQKAECFLDAGEEASGFDLLAHVLAVEPKNPLAFLIRGEAHYDRGRLEQALNDFNRALALNPQLTDALYARGWVSIDTEANEQALDDFLLARKLNQKNHRILVGLGWALHLAGDSESGHQTLTQAIDMNPFDAEAYVFRGRVFQELGDQESLAKALCDFEAAISLDPDDAAAHTGRGFVYLELGETVRALADFARGIALDPDDTDALVGRAEAYLLLKDTDRASDDFDLALSFDANNVEAYLGRSLVRGLRKQWQRALEDCTRAIELDPENSLAFRRRAKIYASLDRDSEAEADMEVANALDEEELDDEELDNQYAPHEFDEADFRSEFEVRDEDSEDDSRDHRDEES